MAKLEGDFQFTGSLGSLSAYRLKGSGTIIIRRKGGASRERVQKAPEFANTRKNNSEFGNCARTAAAIRRTLLPLIRIPDHHLVPPLSALCRTIQVLDTGNEWGLREVQVSRHPHLLEGYNLSRRDSFDSVLHGSLPCVVDRDSSSVEIRVPELRPGSNLRLPENFAYYRLVFSLGLLPDHLPRLNSWPVDAVYADWLPTRFMQPSNIYQLKLTANMPLPDRYSLLVGVGIEMSVNAQEAVKHAGAGKILAVVGIKK
jgi:hypothetical protein